MPMYNRESLVIETLNSIKNQSFKNWECLIIDDHSEDRSYGLVEKWIERDNRFLIFSRPDSRKKGANSCRNFGIEISSGRFIHFFDSDDLADPDCFKIALDAIQSNSYDYCRFGREIFYKTPNFSLDTSGTIINQLSRNTYEDMITYKIVFNTCNVIWLKSSLGEERFNEDIVFGDEWEFYGRLLLKSLHGINIEKTLFYGRKHKNSTTFEYLNQNRERLKSKVIASLSLIDTIPIKLYTKNIAEYFNSLAFQLNSPLVLKANFKKSNFSFFRKKAYLLIMYTNPLSRPLLVIKGKILKKLKS
ncbi:MAG: hypothetical protein CMP12_07085 [Zunongwangia sp.]|nr:hypothetical protein [Zunongwangia sp.]